MEAYSPYEITFSIEPYWPAGWTEAHADVAAARDDVQGLRNAAESAWGDDDTEAAVRAGLKLLRAERKLKALESAHPDYQYQGPTVKRDVVSSRSLNSFWKRVQNGYNGVELIFDGSIRP